MIRILSALIFLLLTLSNACLADGYPSKPIRLVIPFAAGSATDAAGRVLAQVLSQRLGQSVIVDNRAGANGQIAAMLVSQSPADGYTLFMTTNSTHSANPQAILDLVAGRLQVMVADFATAVSQVRAGKLRVLAVTTAKRSALLPGVPPIAETLIGFEVDPLDTVAFGRFVREQLDTWGKLIRAAKIQPE